MFYIPTKDQAKQRVYNKRSDARPARQRQKSATGLVWQHNHPEACAERMRRVRAEKGRNDGIYAQMIDEQRNPIIVELDNVMLTADWHVPFTDESLIKQLFTTAKEQGIKNLIVAGDFWDCDNYSRFTHLSATGTFKQEIDEVRKELKRILSHFERVFFCRGNHEKRWIDLNAGKMGMPELFKLAIPGNISEDNFAERVTITTDDHIHLIQNGQLWLLCHPKNFRITPLSVARDLAAKHLCHVGTAHGHAFHQGRDRSGNFRVFEMGGLFDPDGLDYLRDTSCYPMIRNGFYSLKDGILTPFEGRA